MQQSDTLSWYLEGLRYRSRGPSRHQRVVTEASDLKRTLIARASRDQLRPRISEGRAPYRRLNVRLK